MADNDLFGDSSSDADTDDLIAQAKSQPIARPKKSGGAASKKKKKGSSSNKDAPDADNDDDDDSDVEAGLFDSSSEDEDDAPKKKKLGGSSKKKKKATADSNSSKPAPKKLKPIKKDTRSKQERMEALARKRAGGGSGGSPEEKKQPRKKRSKPNKDGGEPGKEDGYQSGGSYDSETFQRTAEDDDFIDADDEDPDALKELYSEQHFEDERPEGYDSEEEERMKKKAAAKGRKGSGSGGLDKITLSDDEGDETTSASNALKAAVKRMQKKKKEVKKLPQLEEEGIVFLRAMEAAADADDESIKNKKPGLKKLAMLSQVMDVLAKRNMVRVLLDLDLLSLCKRWIQPLPNGTLGNVTLRRRIIESIATMSGENGVNGDDLKKSGFGKVVMTLYMHKSETPEMKKMLKSIIEQWSRPIFRKSGNMHDLERAQRERAYNPEAHGSLVGIARAQQLEVKQEEKRRSGGGGEGKVGRGVKTEDELHQIINNEGSKSTREAGNNRVRVPFSKGFQYSVRPESRKGDVSDKRNLVSAKASAASKMGSRDSEKREALSKRMADKSKKTNKQNQRSANISIEGRVVK